MKTFFGLIRATTLLLVVFAEGCSSDRQPRLNTVSGTVETDEVRVGSRYGGRVIKILAQEGDTLKTGQTIAELEAPELVARRGQIAALLAELEAGPRPEELATARAEWEAQVADLEFARAESRRTSELFRDRTVAESERDRAENRVKVLEKAVIAAESRYALLRAGTREERLAQARAQLAEIDSQLREMRVVAPSDCVLEVLAVKVGDVVAPNQQVGALLLSEHLWVRVFVPQPWLGHLKVGELTEVRVDAFPGRQFAGEVEQIGRQAEFTPRNVQTIEERVKQVFGVKVRLDNRQGFLRAGMSADVTFGNVPRKP